MMTMTTVALDWAHGVLDAALEVVAAAEGRRFPLGYGVRRRALVAAKRSPCRKIEPLTKLGTPMQPPVRLTDLAESRDALDLTFTSARQGKIDAGRAWRSGGGSIQVSPPKLVDPEHQYPAVRQAAYFYDFVSRLGYPPSLARDIAWMRRMAVGTSAGRVTNVLSWLREDPFCLQSGYEKQVVMRLLRRFDFSEGQAEQLRQIILEVLPRGPRKEFRELRRLAPKADSPKFRAALRVLGVESDERTGWRASQVLGACERAAARAV